GAIGAGGGSYLPARLEGGIPRDRIGLLSNRGNSGQFPFIPSGLPDSAVRSGTAAEASGFQIRDGSFNGSGAAIHVHSALLWSPLQHSVSPPSPRNSCRRDVQVFGTSVRPVGTSSPMEVPITRRQ